MEDKTVAIVIAVSIVVGITILIMAPLAYCYFNNRQFIAAGYTQQTLPGHCDVEWVKPEK